MQMSIALNVHQENFFLYQVKTTTGAHYWSIPVYNKISVAKAHCERGDRQIVRATGPGHLLTASVFYI